MASSFGFHLPLSAIDQVNRPPLYYLWVQDGCIITAGLLWTIAYVLYILQAKKDKSYGMPLIALCANIGWELAYGVCFPLSYIETTTFILWFFIDLGIAYSTVKFASEQWRHSPLVADRLFAILGVGCVTSLLMHWAFIKMFVSREEAAFWSGFACQNLLGILSVSQIISRDNTSGHSREIWLCRWMGSFLAIVVFSWRHYHYPENYPFVGSPVAIFMFVLMELVDLTYILVYGNIGTRFVKKDL
ncbi:hypothetical protein EKO27_g9148 [Xylaria grammica]|uniref:Uncharacterized protein n=1 Tax=Xylaria grammica TaxID=363999 RepID=A0A439CUZ7_9PEZI|nr:hypothetical protein EKO27_g9148 [Xylaria grammica]